MLSDSLFDVKMLFLDEIAKYDKHPFSYSRFWKDELQQVLEKLYKIQFALDSGGFFTEEYYERKSKENALKDILKIIDYEPEGEKSKYYTSKSKYGKQDGDKVCEQQQIDANETAYNKKMKELGW